MASNLERDFGALDERVKRLESLRQRLYDLLPLAVVLAVIMSQFVYNAGQFTGVDDRLDRVESRLDRVESRLDGVESRLDGVDSRLAAMETQLQAIGRQLGLGQP
jgi:tetrahydromethanopterin S-methyltransferase subunit G